MAYKPVHDTFWSDPMIRKLPFEEKGFMLYLITNPHAHYSGIYYLPIVFIQTETGLPKRKVKEIMTKLEQIGRIKYDPLYEMVWVVNMAKHQVKSETQIKGVEKHFHMIHPSHLIVAFLQHYNTLSIPYAYPIDTLSIQEEVKEEVKENKGGLFDEFWELYPKRTPNPKNKARARFENYPEDKQEEIIVALKNYIIYQSQDKHDPLKQAQFFLSEDYWHEFTNYVPDEDVDESTKAYNRFLEKNGGDK